MLGNKFIALCLFLAALGAINWGLVAHDTKNNIVGMLPGGTNTQLFAYYLIALTGLVGIYVAYKFLVDEVSFTTQPSTNVLVVSGNSK